MGCMRLLVTYFFETRELLYMLWNDPKIAAVVCACSTCVAMTFLQIGASQHGKLAPRLVPARALALIPLRLSLGHIRFTFLVLLHESKSLPAASLGVRYKYI